MKNDNKQRVIWSKFFENKKKKHFKQNVNITSVHAHVHSCGGDIIPRMMSICIQKCFQKNAKLIPWKKNQTEIQSCCFYYRTGVSRSSSWFQRQVVLQPASYLENRRNGWFVVSNAQIIWSKKSFTCWLGICFAAFINRSRAEGFRIRMLWWHDGPRFENKLLVSKSDTFGALLVSWLEESFYLYLEIFPFVKSTNTDYAEEKKRHERHSY